MEAITTNRALYLVVETLLKRHAETSLSLESYLTTLRALSAPLRRAASIPTATFASLLEAAFSPLVQDTAVDAPEGEEVGPTAEGYDDWDAYIARQIVDLREMQEDGTLDYEFRSYGVNAPSGVRWYNFDPCTFVECGVMGTFGGWEEGDETGRSLVPGPVAVMDADGVVRSVDPGSIEEPVDELLAVTWEEFAEFLESGQDYE